MVPPLPVDSNAMFFLCSLDCLFIVHFIDTISENGYNPRLGLTPMLIVDLKKVTEEGETLDRAVPLAALDRATNDFRVPQPIRLSARVLPLEDGVYRLYGELQAGLDVDCGRCLEPVTIVVGEKLELMYVPRTREMASGDTAGTAGSARPAKNGDRELEDDEMAVSYYQENELDLGQLIWEQLYLALPMRPLCKDACVGLCPRCGVNRNVEQCDCDTQDLDPRMALLKSLLESGKA